MNGIDLSPSWLTREQFSAGLRLFDQPDDDLLVLYLGERVVKSWPRKEAKIMAVLFEADQELERSRNGVTYEKEG